MTHEGSRGQKSTLFFLEREIWATFLGVIVPGHDTTLTSWNTFSWMEITPLEAKHALVFKAELLFDKGSNSITENECWVGTSAWMCPFDRLKNRSYKPKIISKIISFFALKKKPKHWSIANVFKPQKGAGFHGISSQIDISSFTYSGIFSGDTLSFIIHVISGMSKVMVPMTSGQREQKITWY